MMGEEGKIIFAIVSNLKRGSIKENLKDFLVKLCLQFSFRIRVV